MSKRKGSRKYKPIKKWTKHKKGDRRTYYIKNTNPYEFKIKQGGTLQVQARTKKAAVKSAKSWERWLKRTGRGTDKVDFSKGITKWTEKGYKKLKT